MKGNIPVIPTPFVDGKIDYEDFERLILHTGDYVEGYVIGGSTGEAPALSAEERIEIAAFFANRLPGKQIVIGLGHTNLAEASRIGRAAVDMGIRSALVPSPYYFPNSLGMVKAYVAKLAANTGMDIVFYDNPVTTGTTFATEQLIELAQAVPAIRAIKMTDHNMEKIRGLKRETPLAVFAGDDIVCYRAIEAGVDGSMIIAPLIYPQAFKEGWDLYLAGKREESFAVFARTVLPFVHMFGPGDEIPTTKALFRQLGLFKSAETRLPLLPADAARTRETLLGYEYGLAAALP
ncbi:dihydrodipicolinate synthase family protein [Cohnella sp. GCM10012308]|uniref:dihydrodipicolinate synthase family protein n=1 Tax=Cohnella sp. GCM10012308 TaxID=3317329 RepID=UPI00361B2402